MSGASEAASEAFRRIAAVLPALATLAVGFGLALTAETGVLGQDDWSFWLAVAAGPVLVTLGAILYLRRRDRVRRESAWDIFVERELERLPKKTADRDAVMV
jgi:xanthine dehydrogenase iron-sulfur cluster and FAD-binding subunit A